MNACIINVWGYTEILLSSEVQDYLGIAKQILDTIYFYNGKMFGLRGQRKKLNWQCS